MAHINNTSVRWSPTQPPPTGSGPVSSASDLVGRHQCRCVKFASRQLLVHAPHAPSQCLYWTTNVSRPVAPGVMVTDSAMHPPPFPTPRCGDACAHPCAETAARRQQRAGSSAQGTPCAGANQGCVKAIAAHAAVAPGWPCPQLQRPPAALGFVRTTLEPVLSGSATCHPSKVPATLYLPLISLCSYHHSPA